MARLLLLFTVLCSVLYAETALDIQKKKLIVRRLEQCRGKRHLPMVFHNMSVTRDPKTDEVSFDFDVTVREVISNNLAIVVSLAKCDTSGNPDRCEYAIKDFNATNICELITRKNEMWSEFIEHIHPPLVCPIKVGVYHIDKCPASAKSLEYLPVSDAVWKVQLVGWDTGRMISCVDYEEQVVASYKNKS